MRKIICFVLAFSVAVTYSVCFADEAEVSAPATEYVSEGMYDNFETASVLSEAVQTDEIEINATCGVLAEVSTGKILYAKNENETRSPASITKIMTLLLCVEAIDSGRLALTDKVTASEHASSMGGSQIWLKPGETMTVDEMLKAVTVASANDAAVALAEHIGGSEEGFVMMMNSRAKELSMDSTCFKNACGLDVDGHFSTAADIAKMSCELLKHDLIKNYSTIWMDYLRDGKTQLVNTNKLVRFYEGATGLKTGTTDKAGYCVAASAQKNGMELVAVILDGETSDKRFSSAKALLNYGFGAFELTKKTLDETAFQTVMINHGLESTADITFDREKSFLLKKGKANNIEIKINMAESVNAPVSAGQLLGKVSFLLDGEIIGESDVLAAKAVDKITFKTAFCRLLKEFFKT